MYVVYRIDGAIYPHTASGRWSTVACEKNETIVRTEKQQASATDNDNARFFNARRRWAYNDNGYRYCSRWTAPVAWGDERRLVETATPVYIPCNACGTREHVIIGNATSVDRTEDAGHEIYTFYLPRACDERNVYDTCKWDATTGAFVG